MSMTVGELTAYLKLDDREYNRKVDAAGGKFSGLGTRLGGVSSKIGAVAMGAAVGGVAAIGAGLVAGAYAGLKFNSSIEQTTIAMGTMLGSTSKAKTLIGEVTKMAAATPFEFPELADATKRLVAYGVGAKDAVPLMRRLGDVSSALNVPIGEMADLYGKMKVSGRITMEDINQMAGRGIPIYGALAKTLGVSQSKIRGLVETGKIGFPDVQKAFEGMTDKGSMFGGMMDKQSRSFAGLMSTLKDGLVQVFATGMKPLFTWLAKTAMPAVIAALPTIQKVVGQVVKGIGGAFKVIGSIISFVKGLFAGGLGSGASSFIGPIKDIITNLGKLWDVIKGPLQTAGAAIIGALGAAFTYIKPLLVEHMQTVAKVIGYVVRLAQFIKQHWGGIVSVVGPIFAILKTTIVTAFKVIVDVVRVAMALIRGDWSGAWAGVKRIVANVAKGIIAVVRSLGQLVVAILRAAWNALKSVVSAAWNAMVSAAKSGASRMLAFVTSLPGKILSALGSLGSILYDAGLAIIQGLYNGIVSKFNDVKNFVGGIGSWIKDHKGPLSYDAQLLRPAGQAIMSGLVAGLNDGMVPLSRAVGRVTHSIGPGAGMRGRGFAPLTIQVVVPGGTTLIGEASRVGEILAPHVERALERSYARAGRSR